MGTARTANCWDLYDTTCQVLTLRWAQDSTDGTYFTSADDAVHLQAGDARAPFTVMHEIGHALMNDLYEGAYFSTANCSQHLINRSSSAGCTWSEGFAEWFPAMVLRDKTFDWPGYAFSEDLENRDQNTPGWDDGATVEGRVAGALIDLSDSANETGDVVTEGDALAGATWTIVARSRPSTFASYWAARRSLGYTAGPSALMTLAHNSIII